MKKRDLYTFEQGLEMASFNHPRCTYAVNKNKRMVRQTIEDMEKSIEQSEKLKEFGKKREDLAKEHSEKDEQGNPVLKDVPIAGKPGKKQKIYVIPGQDDEKSKYRKALAKLEKEYEEEIKAQEDKVDKYNREFLEDETEFKPFMLDGELLDQHEKCPQPVMDLIFWMVDYKDEPKD
jgi:seryl-tRNA synthetase